MDGDGSSNRWGRCWGSSGKLIARRSGAGARTGIRLIRNLNTGEVQRREGEKLCSSLGVGDAKKCLGCGIATHLNDRSMLQIEHETGVRTGLGGQMRQAQLGGHKQLTESFAEDKMGGDSKTGRKNLASRVRTHGAHEGRNGLLAGELSSGRGRWGRRKWRMRLLLGWKWGKGGLAVRGVGKGKPVQGKLGVGYGGDSFIISG